MVSSVFEEINFWRIIDKVKFSNDVKKGVSSAQDSVPALVSLYLLMDHLIYAPESQIIQIFKY